MNRITLWIALVLVTLLALAACAPVQPAAAPAAEAAATEAPAEEAPAEGALPDLDGRVVQVAMANDYTPLQFIDPATGEPAGWEYDFLAALAPLINVEIAYNNTSWDAMIPAVQTGQFDMGMDGITITADRAEQVDFSAPYMESQQFLLVRADEERFTAAADLAANEELLIGSQAGTSGFYTAVYDLLDGNEANPRIILFDNFGASVQALISGDVDTVLVDAASGAGYIGANPDALKIVGDAIKSEEFGIIFTPGSDLIEAFNAGIAALAADGTLETLNNKWFFEYDPGAQ